MSPDASACSVQEKLAMSGHASSRRLTVVVAGVGAAVVVSAGVGLAIRGGGDQDSLPRLAPEVSFGLRSLAPGSADFSLSTPRIEAPGKQIQILSVETSRSKWS